MYVIHRAALIILSAFSLSACTGESAPQAGSKDASPDEVAVQSVKLALSGNFDQLYAITDTAWDKDQWMTAMNFGFGALAREVAKCGGVDQVVVSESKVSASNDLASFKVWVTLKNRDQKGCASFNPGDMAVVKTAAGWRNKG